VAGGRFGSRKILGRPIRTKEFSTTDNADYADSTDETEETEKLLQRGTEGAGRFNPERRETHEKSKNRKQSLFAVPENDAAKAYQDKG
jgi:hypothetical protein